MTALTPAMRMEGIRFRYHAARTDVLHGVSLDIAARSVTAVLGPNGSGKTTILRLLLGLSTPQSGQVWLDSRPRGSYSRRQLSRRIGLVPQNEPIAFEMSVLEYVLLGRAPYLGLLELPSSADVEIAQQALFALGLEDLGQRPVSWLSGGERQLVVVARALAQEPAIFLMDEPTSHLDLANRRRILQVLAKLAARGKTVVFTTHDPNAAAAVAEEVVLLRRGHVLATGPVEQVLTMENLTRTYGVDVQVVEFEGRPLVVGC